MDVQDEVAAEGHLGKTRGQHRGGGVSRKVTRHDDDSGDVDHEEHGSGDDREAVNGPQQRWEDEVVQEDETEEPLAQQIHRAEVEGLGESINTQHREDEGLHWTCVGGSAIGGEEEGERSQDPGGPEHRVDAAEGASSRNA